MTAGAGILHEKRHSPAFTRSGGALEMVQLWVNLPAKDNMTAPDYQTILEREASDAALPGGAGRVRVIAGRYGDQAGPARTFSPMHVWDMRLTQRAVSELTLAEGWTVALIVLHGSVSVNGSDVVGEAQMVVLDRAARRLAIEAFDHCVVLLLSGEPIDEPIVGDGPLVMNTQQEIAQAFVDFNSGRSGRTAS
jgi:redox-sensitive bicupin YhaK (pirin superfamily)